MLSFVSRRCYAVSSISIHRFGLTTKPCVPSLNPHFGEPIDSESHTKYHEACAPGRVRTKIQHHNTLLIVFCLNGEGQNRYLVQTWKMGQKKGNNIAAKPATSERLISCEQGERRSVNLIKKATCFLGFASLLQDKERLLSTRHPPLSVVLVANQGATASTGNRRPTGWVRVFPFPVQVRCCSTWRNPPSLLLVERILHGCPKSISVLFQRERARSSTSNCFVEISFVTCLEKKDRLGCRAFLHQTTIVSLALTNLKRESSSSEPQGCLLSTGAVHEEVKLE